MPSLMLRISSKRFARHEDGLDRIPLLRFVTNFKNYFTARVARRYLLLRFHRFRKRKSLRHDYFDFLVIDQVADLCELF